MAKVESFKCEGCGILKGQTNHWFMVRSPLTSTLYLSAWTEAPDNWEHYCSDACIIKAVQKWLTALQVASAEAFAKDQEPS